MVWKISHFVVHVDANTPHFRGFLNEARFLEIRIRSKTPSLPKLLPHWGLCRTRLEAARLPLQVASTGVQVGQPPDSNQVPRNPFRSDSSAPFRDSLQRRGTHGLLSAPAAGRRTKSITRNFRRSAVHDTNRDANGHAARPAPNLGPWPATDQARGWNSRWRFTAREGTCRW
jgi:hypothetical protein